MEQYKLLSTAEMPLTRQEELSKFMYSSVVFSKVKIKET